MIEELRGVSMSGKNFYMILDIDIHNPENYKKYIELGKPLVERFGGQYLIRGCLIDASETELWKPKRIVVIKFPDKESAMNWYNSEEYNSIKKIRLENSKSTLLFIEGPDQF